MEEKQIKKRTNWKKKYNDLVKIYQELYLPLCRYLTNDILPILNTQQFNVMCDVYSLKPKNVLALASLLRRDLNSANKKEQKFKTENFKQGDSQPEDNDPDYKVGYKHPPKHTRFQKGDKGNPKGRKSKKDMPIDDLLLDDLNKLVYIKEGGKTKKMYKREVITKNLSKSLMLGEPIPRNNLKLIKDLDRYAARKEVIKKIWKDDNS